MVLAFPIFVTAAGSIYNSYNPMVGERIYQEDNKEFDFKGERYTPLPYFYSGDKETDSPVVATAVNHFLWVEMSGDQFYEFNPSYPYELLYAGSGQVYSKKTEKEEVTSFFENSTWTWKYADNGLSLTEEENNILRTVQDGLGEEIHISSNVVSTVKKGYLTANSADARICLRSYALLYYQNHYYQVGNSHFGTGDAYYSCYPISEKAESVLEAVVPKGANEDITVDPISSDSEETSSSVLA